MSVKPFYTALRRYASGQIPRYLGQPSNFTHSRLMAENDVIPGLSQTEFADRRQKLLEFAVETANSNNRSRDHLDARVLLLIPAASVSFYAQDVPYPFYQNSNFLYFTGFQEPDSLLAITKSPGSLEHRSTLFVKHRDPTRELWEGPRAGTDGALQLTNVDQALEHSDFEHFLMDVTKSGDVCLGFESDRLPKNIQMRVIEVLNRSDRRGQLELLSLMHRVRWIKSQAEMDLMRKTCAIGSGALTATMAFTKPNLNESHLVAHMDLESRLRGAQCLAYPPVVAGGARANIIHYLNADQTLEAGDLVLMDAGCSTSGYASDITRTWPINGRFSQAQRQLYEALHDVQCDLLNVVQNVRPLTLADLYHVQMELLGTHLQGLSVISSDLKGQELRNAVERFCPHHVSHYLGLDVHDTHTVPRNIPLKPGVTITVEPGLYIPNDESVAGKFRGIGMRIEDDVLITDVGADVLTETCPKSVEQIEQICK